MLALQLIRSHWYFKTAPSVVAMMVNRFCHKQAWWWSCCCCCCCLQDKLILGCFFLLGTGDSSTAAQTSGSNGSVTC
jgi:hypothetical protein